MILMRASARISRSAGSSHDVGANSSVGVIFTDREFAGTYNRVGGFDTNFDWGRTGISIIAGWSARPRTLPEGYLYGSDNEGSVEGNGRRFSFVSQYQDISSGISHGDGFRKADRHPTHEQLLPFLFSSGEEAPGVLGAGVDGGAHLGPFGHRGRIQLSTPISRLLSATTWCSRLSSAWKAIRLRPQDFPGLTQNRKFIQDFVGHRVTCQPIAQIYLQPAAVPPGKCQRRCAARGSCRSRETTSASIRR